MAPYNCAAAVAPPSGLITDFTSFDTTGGGRWTSSNGLSGIRFWYHGGTSTSTFDFDATKSDLRLVASVVAASYAGGGILFDVCETAGTNTRLQFTVTGTTNCGVELQLQTYAQKPSTDMPAGGCATGTCSTYPRAASLSVATSPVTVTFTSMTNWTTASASQLVGIQWQVTSSASAACTADLHFDNVKLLP